MRNKKLQRHFLLIILFSLLINCIRLNTVFADIENCNGTIFTDSKSGKKACILEGWKKETRNSNASTGDYFYYNDTDIYVALDIHPFYNDLTEEDRKKITQKDLATFTMSDSQIEEFVAAAPSKYTEMFNASVTGSTMSFNGFKWGEICLDFSPSGYDVKSTMYCRVIDGYFFAIVFDPLDSNSEELAQSMASDFSSQVIYPYSSINDPYKKADISDALGAGILKGLEKALGMSLVFLVLFAFRKLISVFRKDSSNKNQDISEEKEVLGSNQNTIQENSNLPSSIQDENSNSSLDFSNELEKGTTETVEECETNNQISNNELPNSVTQEEKEELENRDKSIIEERAPISQGNSDFMDKAALKKIKSSFKDGTTEENEKEIPTVQEKTRIRFCRKCGAELNENTLFCRKCGTKIGE